MAKPILKACLALLILWVAITLLGGWLLPDHLLRAPVPFRTDAQRAALRARLTNPEDRWTFHEAKGGEGASLHLDWLHRPHPRGVALFLHGFGDDAFGTAGYSASLPDWDAVIFTFRALHTPIALVTGDADAITPLAGVRAIARYHPDLVVVPGAGHCEAGGRLPQGWSGWAHSRLARWGLLD